MKYILSALLFFCVASLYAQPTASRKVSITTNRFSGAVPPPVISGIRVFFASPDTLALGYVAAEKGNEAFKLVPEGKNSRWLDTLVNKRYGNYYAATGNRLVWVVKDLSVTTDSSSRFYFSHLKADVFSNGNVKTFDPLLSVDTVLSGVLTSSDYAPGITEAIDALYQASLTGLTIPADARKLMTAKADKSKMTEDSIALLAKVTPLLSILKDAVYRAGIYTSYSEFTNNRPSITGALWAVADTSKSSGYVKIFSMGQDSVIKQHTDIWGVCFGGTELYKCENGLLIPIEKAGNAFILSRYQEPFMRKNQARYWYRMAIDGWPGDTNPFDRKRILLFIPGDNSAKLAASPAPIATRIDMATGTLTF